jgi:hypothetical protein
MAKQRAGWAPEEDGSLVQVCMMYDMQDWKQELMGALWSRSWRDIGKRLRFFGVIFQPTGTSVLTSSDEATEFIPASEGRDPDSDSFCGPRASNGEAAVRAGIEVGKEIGEGDEVERSEDRWGWVRVRFGFRR